MKIKFWGVRGSIPTPGQETVKYGGNTSCVELRTDDNELIIFDAGTGIRCLGNALMKEGKKIEGSIFISHTHWDHIQGLPFFVPAFIPSNKFKIFGCKDVDISFESLISGQMKSSYFPIDLESWRAEIEFVELAEGKYDISDNVVVETIFIDHPGFTLGYKLIHNGKSIVYISDNEPFVNDFMREGFRLLSPPTTSSNSKDTLADDDFLTKGYYFEQAQRMFDFFKNADLLVHDAQYSQEEYKKKIGWGHSAYADAVEFAIYAGVENLALYHHDPMTTDDMLDKIEIECKESIRNRNLKLNCFAAKEGMEIKL